MRRSNPEPNTFSDLNEPDCFRQLVLSICSFFKPAQQAYEPIPEMAEIPVERKKTVKFNTINRIILVASRSSYVKCELNDKLWFNEDEFATTKRSIMEDIANKKIEISGKQFIFNYEDEDNDDITPSNDEKIHKQSS